MGKKKKADERFSKFGTVTFTTTTKVNDFIDHLEEDKVTGTRCTSCGKSYFPPRADCSGCLTSQMEWFDVKGAGKLVSCSKLKFGPVGFEDDLPYTIALLDYGEYKVFGRISNDVPDDQIKIGMEMETTVNTLSNGQLNYVFSKP